MSRNLYTYFVRWTSAKGTYSNIYRIFEEDVLDAVNMCVYHAYSDSNTDKDTFELLEIKKELAEETLAAWKNYQFKK